jgi:hypothetical protein
MALAPAGADSDVVDLVPFIFVSYVDRSIRFWEALGFRVAKRYEPNGRLEFAGLESTAAAKVMLARVDRPSERDPDGNGHMVAELWPGSIAGRSAPSGAVSRLLAVLRAANQML